MIGLPVVRFLCVFFIALSASSVNGQTGESDYVTSLKWLYTGGWFRPTGDTDFENWSESRVKAEIRLPLRRMKSYFFDGKQDGELTAAAKALMNETRCGVPDVSSKFPSIASRTIGSRFKRYSYLGSQIWRQDRFPVTIGYNNYSTQVPRNVQDQLAKDCAAKWAEVSGLSFRFVRNQIANIHISYVQLRNRNGEINGRWGVVGKGLSPVPDAKPPSSWIKMDTSEVWKAKQSSNHKDRYALSIEEVLCHEIGHTLGLGHSRDRNAIMYPTVGFRSKDVELGQDDIAGIQSHYGKPKKNPPTTQTKIETTTTTTPRPTKRITTTRPTTRPTRRTTTTTRPSTTTRRRTTTARPNTTTRRRTTTTTARPNTTTRRRTTTTARPATTQRTTTTRQTNEVTTSRPSATTALWRRWIGISDLCSSFPDSQREMCERVRNRNRVP